VRPWTSQARIRFASIEPDKKYVEFCVQESERLLKELMEEEII
jgi:hypothetical protein